MIFHELIFTVKISM